MATDARQAAIISERGRDAANPAIVDLIKNSAGESSSKGTADSSSKKKDLQEQVDKSSKPAFEDIGARVEEMTTVAKDRNDILIKEMRIDHEARRKFEERREKESGAKIAAFTAMADAAISRKRGVEPAHPDIIHIKMDQKESAIARSAAQDLKAFADLPNGAGALLTEINTNLLQNCVKRIRSLNLASAAVGGAAGDGAAAGGAAGVETATAGGGAVATGGGSGNSAASPITFKD